MKEGETDGGLQAVRQLFLLSGSTVILHSCCMLISCLERKGKGSPTRGHVRVHLPLKQVFSLFYLFMFSASVKWLATFLWRPLAGREGRTVLSTNIDQTLAGLEARQRLAARDRRQGSTQAHHGGGVILCCRAHAREEASTDECRCVCSLRGGPPPCVQPLTGNVTCAPSSTVLLPLRPLGIRVEAYLHRQQLCAGETPPEGEWKSALRHSGSQGR